MSSFAVVLVVFGLLIAITRAPFVFAPVATRDLYMKMFDSDRNLRLLGLFLIGFGVFTTWGTSGYVDGLAPFFYYLGWLMIFVGLGPMALFPGVMRPFAKSVLESFSVSGLRIIGAFAVTIGVLLAAYGMSI